MFLDTLDINERVVFTALNKMNDLGITDNDKRGLMAIELIPKKRIR